MRTMKDGTGARERHYDLTSTSTGSQRELENSVPGLDHTWIAKQKKPRYVAYPCEGVE